MNDVESSSDEDWEPTTTDDEHDEDTEKTSSSDDGNASQETIAYEDPIPGIFFYCTYSGPA